MSPRGLRAASISLAVVFALAGCYCAFWMFASADMSFVPCDNHYSLFSLQPRCRTPYIAMTLCALFLLLSVASIVLGRRKSLGKTSANSRGDA